MKIEECQVKAKCDFYGCNNMAKYSFSTKGIFKNELVFCQDCLDQMFECLCAMKVPKGRKSPFRLNDRLGGKNEK